MPTVVHVKRRGWVYSPFTCEHCKHEDQAAVYVSASAGAQTGLLQDFDDTRDLAHGTAHGAMEDGGNALIALACCPQCGVRDELATRSYYAKATPWLAGGGVFLAIGLAGAGYMASRSELFLGSFIMAPIIVIGVVALLVGVVKRFRRLPGGTVAFRSVDPGPWSGLDLR